MPIINGKNRYIAEPREFVLKSIRRFKPQTSPVASTSSVKRYQPESKPTNERVIKRAADGGGAVETVLHREATRRFIGTYEFDVRINTIQVNFSKVSNISNKVETETFIEGGNNNYPIIRQKARSEPDIIVFEKGLTDTLSGSVFDMFKQGMRLTNIMIFVKKNGKVARSYCIDEGLIVSKKFSDLDANSSQLYIQTLEIAHTGLTEVPVL